MAKLFTDFSNDTIGQLPAGTTLRRNAVTGDYQVVSEGGVNQLRFLNSGAQSARGLAWPLAAEGITEVYVHARQDYAIASNTRLIISGTDSPDNELCGYYVRTVSTSDSRIRLSSRLNGANTDRASFDYSPNIPSEDYFKILFRVDPVNELFSVKLWHEDDDPPVNWDLQLDLPDGIDPEDGWVGLLGFSANNAVFYKAIGIGTYGDPAPTSPVDDGIDVSISATELGYDVASVGINNAIQLAVNAVETGQDSAAVSLDNHINLSITAIESGNDTATIQIQTDDSISLEISALETGADTAAVSINNPVSVEVIAQEQGADTAQLIIIAGDIYVIPDGCTSIEDVSPVYSLSDTSPIYSIEDVTCQLQ